MKIKNTSLVVLLLAGALISSVTGCKKEAPGVPTAAEPTQPAVDPAADAVQGVAADAKAGAEKAADQIDSIIAKTKALIDSGKFEDALNALNGLAGMTLSEEQQKMVDSLKQQIQKALAGKATESGASAVGNLLGK